VDQIEVADIYDGTGGLPDREHDIPPQQGVDQQKKTTEQAEIPKADGNDTFLFPLGNNPLPEKAHEKKALAQKANGQQPPLG
jgi:hypothetical protein